MTRKIIGESLHHYSGTIIAVTHDIDFVHDLKPDTLLIMPEGKVVSYDTRYEDLLKRA